MPKSIVLQKLKSSKSTLLILIVFIAILFGGSFVRLNELSIHGLESDEMLHIYAAKSLLESGEPKLPSGLLYDRSLPYTWLVALSFKCFGMNEFSARLPSVVFGLMTIILLFFVGKSLFNLRVGLIAGFLIAFLPFEIVMSRFSRMYSMYQFFYILSIFSFYKFSEESEVGHSVPGRLNKSGVNLFITIIPSLWPRLRWILIFVSSSLISYSLHSLSLILGMSLVCYIFAKSIYDGAFLGVKRLIRSKYFLASLLISVILVIVLFIKGKYELFIGLSQFAHPEEFNSKATIGYYIRFLASHYMQPIRFLFPLSIIMVTTRMSKQGFFLLVFAIVPLTIHSLFVSIQSPRYIYDILPIILLLVAYSINNLFDMENNIIERMLDKSKLRLVRLSFILLFFCLIIFNFSGFHHAFQISKFRPSEFGGMSHAQKKEAFEFIKKVAQQGDVIITDLPLAAHFYEVNNELYHLDNYEKSRFRERAGDNLKYYHLMDVEAITNIEEFKYVVGKHARGWIVMDKSRFYNAGNVPLEISKFVEKTFKQHSTVADDSMIVFSWE